MHFQISRLMTAAFFAALSASSMAGLVNYSQNFEGLDMSSSSALSGNGWKIFANVFDSGGGYIYGYGPFGAPNGGPGFSSIATGEQGPGQGAQYLNTYSDYNNGDHANGRFIEANIFQEQIIGASDLGNTVQFNFDYKASSQFGPGGQTVTRAFIKVLNPNAGFSMVAFPNLVTTSASTSSWASGNLSLLIDNGWSGHILQFGFMSTATQYQPSGVYYDNINFNPVPEPATMTAALVGLAGVALRKRRK